MLVLVDVLLVSVVQVWEFSIFFIGSGQLICDLYLLDVLWEIMLGRGFLEERLFFGECCVEGIFLFKLLFFLLLLVEVGNVFIMDVKSLGLVVIFKL